MAELTSRQQVAFNKYYHGSMKDLESVPLILGSSALLNSFEARALVVSHFAESLARDPNFRSPNDRDRALSWLTSKLNTHPGLQPSAEGLTMSAAAIYGLAGQADKLNFKAGLEVGNVRNRVGDPQKAGKLELSNRLLLRDGAVVPAELNERANGTEGNGLPLGLGRFRPARDIYESVLRSVTTGEPVPVNMLGYVNGPLRHGVRHRGTP
jgi:hypothetical protein